MSLKKWPEILVVGVIILTLVLLISSLSSAAAPQNVSIGYVDMSRLQNDIPESQRLQDQIKDKESEFKLFQGYVLQQHRNVLKDLQDKANQEKAGKTADEQTAIDNRFNEEVQKKNADTQNQLEQKRAEIMKQLNEQKKAVEERIKKLIADVAAEQKISVVFDKGAVLYGGTDLTQAVIDRAKKEAEAAKAATPTTKPAGK